MELVLNTFGASLGREQEGFIVSTNEGKQRIPADAIDSIQISRGAQITSDAVMLAVEREIEIIFMDKSGNPAGRVWSPKYGSISTIRKGQINFCFSKDAVDWIKNIIIKKISNQQALLLIFSTDNPAVENQRKRAITRLEDYSNKIRHLSGDIVQDISSNLRGWEGVSSKIYFEAINLFIPEKYNFSCRSQHPALDIANALLNYGYGVLYGKIESALIKAGIDPYVGVLHRDDYNRPVLVYDVIELYRVWIDFIVFNLLRQDVISDEFFSVKDDGSYWLEPLGRRVLIQSINDYFEEVIDLDNGQQRSRSTNISLYAQSLAQQFKQH